MSFFDKTIKDGLKTYIKRKATLTPAEIEAILPAIKKDFQEQSSLPIEQRKGYFTDKDGSDYLVFKTDAEAITDKEGNVKNKPKMVGEKKDTLMMWAHFPLLTDPDASYPTRINIFDRSDELKNNKVEWKTLVLAKGRVTVQYKLLGDQGYAKPLPAFLKEQGIESLEEIDSSDYLKNYTFNLDQVLETVSL